jgi:surface antigen
MWSRRSVNLVAAATLSLLASLNADAAAGLMFLRESPLSRFTEQDFEILRNAANVVLGSSELGAAQEWSNDASGNSGRITALQQFTATDGRLCKRLTLDARSSQFDGSWTYTVCRGADGDWKIDGAAQPGNTTVEGAPKG